MKYLIGLKTRLEQIEAQLHYWRQIVDDGRPKSFDVPGYIRALEDEERRIRERLNVVQPGRSGR